MRAYALGSNRVFIVAVSLSLTACTSVTVRALDPALRIRHACIQDKSKVLVSDFVPVLRDGFDRHGITTEVYSGTKPANCDYVFTYAALRSWDFAPYLLMQNLGSLNGMVIN